MGCFLPRSHTNDSFVITENNPQISCSDHATELAIGAIDIIRPVRTTFDYALHHHIYRLILRSPIYEDQVAQTMYTYGRPMESQIKSHHFDGDYPIRIIPSFNRFRAACDSTRVHEFTEIWRITSFLRGSALDKLQLRTETDAHRTSDNSSNLRRY